MKTFTCLVCMLLSAFASYAAEGGHGRDDLAGKADPFSLCVEAENAGGTGPVTEDPNASNGKTRGDQNNWDHYVEYEVYGVLATSEHQMTIRYYAAGNANVSISVNGAVAIPSLALAATNSWNIVWAEQTVSVNLNQGNNRVRIQGLQGYSVRQDKICVTGGSGPNEPVSCNFNMFPRVSSQQVLPGQAITLDANCEGSDCSNVNFTWSGNGVNVTGSEVTVNVPATPGNYSYDLTATKYGCITKTSRVFFTVKDTLTCDFRVGAFSPSYFASCATQITLIVECDGGDCYDVKYQWSGNGANGTSSTSNAPAPTSNGTFDYIVTASKNGCPDITTRAQVVVSDCPDAPGEPYAACVEAENSEGNGPVTEDPNASNGKTRGAENNWDHYVEYEVNGVKAAGPHELTLRYYAAQDGAVDVIVNGGEIVPVVGLPSTHSWNISWGERTITVNLVKGNNKIRIVGLPDYSPVRQDKICVTGSGGPEIPPVCDFNIRGGAVTISPSCKDAVAIYALCSGSNCESVSYQWTGHDINLPGRIAYLDPPGQNGTFAYTVTASNGSCPPKTATVAFTVGGCGDVAEPFSACVEAEHSVSDGLGTDDPNASNGQTRGAEDNYNYYVEYTVNDVPDYGYYPVTLRYYAAGNARVSVTVNGAMPIPSLPLATTNSWNIVSRDETFYVNLYKGSNIIRIQGLPGPACRQDRLCVSTAVSGLARMAAPGAVELQTEATSLQAFPNPAPGEFKAEFDLQPGKTATLEVIDVKGKMWHQRQVTGRGQNEERIILNGAPTGIYLLQVKKPDKVETKKILITH